MAIIDLAKVPVTQALADADGILVQQGGDMRQISRKDFLQGAGDDLMLPTFTLEQTSSPAFDVIKKSMAVENYIANMGGYGFKVKNGKVYAAKLNPSDWSRFTDGTAVDASQIETMIHVPICNFKASGKTMQFGGLTHIDGGQTFGSPEWVGAYKMYVDGSGVGHSRPDVAPSHSRIMSAFWSCAQKLGSEFGLANYQFYCLINAVYQAAFGNLNSQATIGTGFQHSNWEACRDVTMGRTRSLGDGSGSVLYKDDTLGSQYPVKLFGFEDLWGKLWEFRPGIRFYMDGSQRYAIVYDGNVVSNTASGRKFSMKTVENKGGRNVGAMVLGEHWDMICKAYAGGSSDYYTDGFWEATGGELLFVGGNAVVGAACGVSSAHSYYGFSFSGTGIGARLAFFGKPQFVSGHELMAM